MKPSLLIVMFLTFTTFASAQNTIPDSLFANNALLIADPGPGNATGTAFLSQPDGKIIYGGYDYNINQNDFHIDMTRFDICGNLDETFGDSGVVHYKFDQRNIAYAYALQPDGKIVVAGMEAPSNAGSQQIPAVSRFNADGTPDSTFHNTGSYALRFDPVSSGAFYSVYVLPDGRILAIGTSSGNINGGQSGGGAMRFMPDGTLDATFDGDGIARLNTATSTNRTYGHLMPDGKIIFIASQYDVSFIDHFFSFAFDSTGAQDNSFATTGTFLDTSLVNTGGNTGTALQPDGKIIMAANRTNSTGTVVIRITSDGQLDQTFGINGHTNFNIVGFTFSSVHLLSSGKILLGGGFTSGFGVGAAVMLNSDGSIDNTFGMSGFQIYDINNGTGTHSFDDLLVLPDGKWLAGTGSTDLLVKKFSNTSNVPHITQDSNLDLVSTGAGTFQWYLDSAAITGATTNPFTPTEIGTYNVVITDATGCTYMSAPLTITAVGIDELTNNDVLVFPNPVTEKLTITINNNQPIELILYDITSKKISEQRITATATIDMKEFCEGVYLYEVKSENGLVRKGKIVKHR